MGDMGGAAAAAATAIRVLIVDDHELLAHILARSLDDGGFDVVSVTGDDLDDTLSIAGKFQPEVCLLDVDLGEGGDGRSLIGPLRAIGCEVILLTASRDESALGLGIERGACGVMTKDEPFEKLVDAVAAAAAGHRDAFAPRRHRCLSALRDHRARDEARRAPFERLTPREREVLAELGRGKTAAAIAEASYVSLSTVRSQIRSVLTKLGVSNQLAAVAVAHRSRWL